MASSPSRAEPTTRAISAHTRARWLELRALLGEPGLTREQAAARVGLSDKGLQSLLRRAGGSGVWPPDPFPGYMLEMPLSGGGAHRWRYGGRGAGRVNEIAEARLDGDALARRIARDQAGLHAPRLGWLEAERQRYGLARRGRLPEEMAA